MLLPRYLSVRALYTTFKNAFNRGGSKINKELIENTFIVFSELIRLLEMELERSGGEMTVLRRTISMLRPLSTDLRKIDTTVLPETEYLSKQYVFYEPVDFSPEIWYIIDYKTFPRNWEFLDHADEDSLVILFSKNVENFKNSWKDKSNNLNKQYMENDFLGDLHPVNTGDIRELDFEAYKTFLGNDDCDMLYLSETQLSERVKNADDFVQKRYFSIIRYVEDCIPFETVCRILMGFTLAEMKNIILGGLANMSKKGTRRTEHDNGYQILSAMNLNDLDDSFDDYEQRLNQRKNGFDEEIKDFSENYSGRFTCTRNEKSRLLISLGSLALKKLYETRNKADFFKILSFFYSEDIIFGESLFMHGCAVLFRWILDSWSTREFSEWKNLYFSLGIQNVNDTMITLEKNWFGSDWLDTMYNVSSAIIYSNEPGKRFFREDVWYAYGSKIIRWEVLNTCFLLATPAGDWKSEIRKSPGFGSMETEPISRKYANMLSECLGNGSTFDANGITRANHDAGIPRAYSPFKKFDDLDENHPRKLKNYTKLGEPRISWPHANGGGAVPGEEDPSKRPRLASKFGDFKPLMHSQQLKLLFALDRMIDRLYAQSIDGLKK